jgi:GNAT superfamily N-acetyltransferase
MEVSVRRVRPEDWEVLRHVRLTALADAPHAFGSTYAAEVECGEEHWRGRAADAAAGTRVAMFLAWIDDDAVGIVGGFRPTPEVAVVELVSMWTSAAVRGAGIGRRLVDAVIDWARQTGADRVDLWVTRGNDAAAHLYESIGFEVTGDHQPLPSDPCKDEVRMRLPLRAPDRPTG